ncbi:hypothetical protein FKM82_026157 [Ascaphus truei]
MMFINRIIYVACRYVVSFILKYFLSVCWFMYCMFRFLLCFIFVTLYLVASATVSTLLQSHVNTAGYMTIIVHGLIDLKNIIDA